MQSIDSSYSVPPFPAFPSVSRFVPIGPVNESIERVCRSINAREGVALVIGPPGTGKSLLCSVLADRYRPSHDVVMLGESTITDGKSLLRILLRRLGVVCESSELSDLQIALVDRVCEQDSPRGGLLVIVDEAQLLSSEAIESIRMVTNLMRDGQPRVFAVLCGSPALEETLVLPVLEAFSQRVATRCYLHAMNFDETRCYVRETIRGCGADPDETISDEAIASVHHACLGVPRLVNQMMTEAIDCAEEADQGLIDDAMIDRAWSRLQQLPSPIVDEPKMLAKSAPVEFGELDPELKPELLPRNDGGHIDTLAAESDGDACRRQSGVEMGNFGLDCILDAEVDEGFATALPDHSVNSLPASPPLLAEELFGEFDIEEELPVARNVAPPTRPAKTFAPIADDIESILHHEIVGIANVAAAGLRGYDEPLCDDAWDVRLSAASMLEDSIEPLAEDELTSVDLGHDESSPDDGLDDGLADVGDMSSVDNDAAYESDSHVRLSQESVEDGEENIVNDDSDLLVIEDEFELTRIDEIKRVDAREQIISVDFQAMLSRMRDSSRFE